MRDLVPLSVGNESFQPYMELVEDTKKESKKCTPYPPHRENGIFETSRFLTCTRVKGCVVQRGNQRVVSVQRGSELGQEHAQGLLPKSSSRLLVEKKLKTAS